MSLPKGTEACLGLSNGAHKGIESVWKMPPGSEISKDISLRVSKMIHKGP